MPIPSIWVEGSSLCVVDASGTKRTLTGVSMGTQAGAVPGLIGVDRSNGRIVYIDANGVKRYIRYSVNKSAPGAADGSVWVEGTSTDTALKYTWSQQKRDACHSACQESCQTSCQTGCQSGCEVSCQSSCQTGCQTTCERSCQSACQTGCETTCEKSCQNCQGACQTTCESYCQSGCQGYCMVGCEVNCKSGPN